MRDLTLTTKEAITAAETGDVFLLLLTISHTNLAEPIRVVKNTVDIGSRGNTFLAMDFGINMPEETDQVQMPSIRLSVQNVTRQIVEAVRSIQGPATIDLEIVNASEPDEVISHALGMKLRDTQYDELIVTGEVSMDDFLNEPTVSDRMDQVRFPALFRL